MKPLLELQKIAENNEKHREMLLFFPAGPFNARFIDPFLGVFELFGSRADEMQLTSKVFYVSDWWDKDINGLFIDGEND